MQRRIQERKETETLILDGYSQAFSNIPEFPKDDERTTLAS